MEYNTNRCKTIHSSKKFQANARDDRIEKCQIFPPPYTNRILDISASSQDSGDLNWNLSIQIPHSKNSAPLFWTWKLLLKLWTFSPLRHAPR